MSLLCWKSFRGFTVLWEQKANSFPGPMWSCPGLPLQLHLNPLLPHDTAATQVFFPFLKCSKPFLLLGRYICHSIFSGYFSLVSSFSSSRSSHQHHLFLCGKTGLDAHQNVLFLDTQLNYISQHLASRWGCVHRPPQWKGSRNDVSLPDQDSSRVDEPSPCSPPPPLPSRVTLKHVFWRWSQSIEGLWIFKSLLRGELLDREYPHFFEQGITSVALVFSMICPG